jgi:hypothetical protein
MYLELHRVLVRAALCLRAAVASQRQNEHVVALRVRQVVAIRKFVFDGVAMKGHACWQLFSETAAVPGEVLDEELVARDEVGVAGRGTCELLVRDVVE